MIVISGCGESSPEEGDHDDGHIVQREKMKWEKELEKVREEKDRMFTGEESPLSAKEQGHFSGLAYFPPDSSYRVRIRFEEFEQPDTIIMGTTTGEARVMVRAGLLHFTLAEKPLKLTAFRSIPSHGSLFLPFGDETNGNQTYEGGRYIDLNEETVEADSLLDFNNAYNPYCAYNEGWSCPIVPRENFLPISILAGEKVYGTR